MLLEIDSIIAVIAKEKEHCQLSFIILQIIVHVAKKKFKQQKMKKLGITHKPAASNLARNSQHGQSDRHNRLNVHKRYLLCRHTYIITKERRIEIGTKFNLGIEPFYGQKRDNINDVEFHEKDENTTKETQTKHKLLIKLRRQLLCKSEELTVLGNCKEKIKRKGQKHQ